MFDRLIESNSAAAEFKPRRKYFMVSSVVVGILFLSAVVFSLYAQDIGLGTDEFEISAILTPVQDIPEPEPVRQQQQQATNQARTDVPSRPELIARADQSFAIPDTISTTPNKFREIPLGPVRVGPIDQGIGTNRPVGDIPGTSSAVDTPEPIETEVVKTVPPPIVKAEPKRLVSKGVVNGFATDLPKPPYSPAAKAINLTGSVQVQVLIDEFGNVVSAKAVDGHLLFKRDAEQAAKRAKFKPTLLGDQPVRVTGVIVYKFSR